MRKVVVLAVMFAMILALGGCSAPPPAKSPLTNLSVLGTAGGGSATAGGSSSSGPDPAAAEHIPLSAGLLVRAASGPTRISESQAIDAARREAVTKGSTGQTAVHVMLSSDVSRPDSTQNSTGAISAWMVTFHHVELPASSGLAGQIGSATVLVDSDTGKVVKTVYYVPLPN